MRKILITLVILSLASLAVLPASASVITTQFLSNGVNDNFVGLHYDGLGTNLTNVSAYWYNSTPNTISWDPRYAYDFTLYDVVFENATFNQLFRADLRIDYYNSSPCTATSCSGGLSVNLSGFELIASNISTGTWAYINQSQMGKIPYNGTTFVHKDSNTAGQKLFTNNDYLILYGGAQRAAGLHVWYLNEAPPAPPVAAQPVSIQVYDGLTGNGLTGSTVTIINTSTGAGNATNSLGAYHYWNTTIYTPYGYDIGAAKTGYTGDNITQYLIVPSELETYRLYLYPEGAASAGNGTLTFSVMNSMIQPIVGALVQISGMAEYGVTGSMGAVSFEVNRTGVYNYSVSATGYIGQSGSVSLDGEADELVDIFLWEGSPGGVPPATIVPTTISTPSYAHDTTTEALDFIKQNALGLVQLFFVATVLGALGLMSKAFK